MPLAPVVATLLTTPETRSVSLFVGGRDVTAATKWDSVVITDSGSSARGIANLHLMLGLASLPELTDQARVHLHDHLADASAYTGYVRSRRPSSVPGYDGVDVVADDIGGILDDTWIPSSLRPAETLQARIGFLWGYYGGSHLSGDLSHVAAIGGTLPAQNFAGATLRQAIEATLAQASASAQYSVDALGKLHVFIDEGAVAPYNVSAEASPAALTSSGTRAALSASDSYRAFPGIARMTDGRYIAVYRRGTTHLSTDGVAVYRFSADGGVSWSAEQTLYDDPTLDVRDPNVVVTTAGTVLVSFFTWDGASARVVYVKRSTDNGVTWSDNIAVGSGYTGWTACSAAAVQAANGDILLPIYGMNTAAARTSAATRKSTDDGVTWGTQVTLADGVADGRDYQEPCIVRLANNNLLALIHTNLALFYRTTSTNNGTSWPAVAASVAGGGRPSMVNLASGLVLLVTRSVTLSRAVYRTSTDSGVTWTAEAILDPNDDSEPMNYAWAMQLPDARVVVVYAIETSATVSDIYVRRLIGTIAPHDLAIDYDSNSYANRVYVQGATPASSGFFQDDAAIAAANGLVRTATMQAPDCETAAMALALARMYLGRVAGAIARGSFSATSPDDGWCGGQSLTVSSVAHALAAVAFRIARVTTRIVKPGSDLKRRYTVEFGGARVGTPGGSVSALGGGQLVSGELGGASNVYVTSDGVAVTDGTVVRAQIGKLPNGSYGVRIVASDGSVLIDGEQITLTKSTGRIPSGVEFGIAQTKVTADGIEVNDGSVDRVTLGALGGGDYGLKVVNAGSTVIIDGTSNMFKIAATGTLNLTGCNGTAAQCLATTSVTVATGLTFAPAHMGFHEFPTGKPRPLARVQHNASLPGGVTDSYVPHTEVVSGNQSKWVIEWTSQDVDRSATTVTFRYYILKEVAI